MIGRRVRVIHCTSCADDAHSGCEVPLPLGIVCGNNTRHASQRCAPRRVTYLCGTK